MEQAKTNYKFVKISYFFHSLIVAPFQKKKIINHSSVLYSLKCTSISHLNSQLHFIKLKVSLVYIFYIYIFSYQ